MLARSMREQAKHGVRRAAALALAVCFALPPAAPAGERPAVQPPAPSAKDAPGGRWALVVGVDQYQSKDIERLAGAVADAKAIRDALVKYAEIPPSQVMLLTSDAAEKPTAVNILERLEAIKAAAKPDDLLLFFFAGHGVQVEGQRYLLTYDTRIASTAQIKATSLAATTLMQEIEAVKVAHRVVMIDACRNDPTAGGQRPNLADEAFENAFTMLPASEGGVRATFLSCSRGQSAYEWGEKGRGFFSYYIEQGLSGAASTRGKVTFTSLIDYLNEYVPQAVRENRNRNQIPYTKFEGPPFVLVRAQKLSASAAGLDQKPVAPAERTIYGVVKDSGGAPVAGAAVKVAFGAGASGSSAAGTARELSATTDEDGFFRVEGVPQGAEAKVTASKPQFSARTVTAPPAEAGKKLTLFLAREEKPALVADVRPLAPAPATPAPPTTRPTPTAGRSTPKPALPTPAPARPTPEPPRPTPVAPPLAPVASRGSELALVAYRTFLAEDFREAADAARVALSVEPDNALANAVLANALAVLGINSGDASKASEAKQYVAKALARDPGSALACNAQGIVLVAEGKAGDALAAFQKAIQADAKLAPAHANMAYLLSEQGKNADAEREYREAIRLQPDGAVPYNGLSKVLFSLGRYKDMEKACRDAISRYQTRDRFLGLFYVQLATAQYQLGRQDQALEAVSRAKALGVAEHPAYQAIEKGRR